MRQLTRRAAENISGGVLDHLTDLQHMQSHRSLRQCLADSAALLGIAADEIDRSLARLSLDGSGAIGRLRRTELTQLARHIERRRDADDGSSMTPAPLRSAEGCGRS
jgi:hypothetical protein